MFRTAYEIASQFTFPVVLSRRTVSGKCSSSIGVFVVVNEEGWILTAAHIIVQLQKMTQEEKTYLEYESKKAALDADRDIAPKEKRKKLRALGSLRRDATARTSAWWSFPGVQLASCAYYVPGDIAIGKLEPFDPKWVKRYPQFKDPSKPFESGASLCKLGFPFHSIVPTWNATTSTFELPAEAIPIPRFPIEGIFTRVANIALPKGVDAPIPISMIETSSPGLRGQSGGPTFDTKGTVWAIQSRTSHLPLGFSPPVPGGKKKQKEHQFLNVGLGVHPATFLALLDKSNVKYDLADY
jgi:hypothetical protein